MRTGHPNTGSGTAITRVEYDTYLAWCERHLTFGYVKPCQPPDVKGPCDQCEFFGKPVPKQIDVIAAFLSGIDTPAETYVNPGYCAMQLRLPAHPYHAGGDGGCRKCHAARSHRSHYGSQGWDAFRRLWGFYSV